jgi:methyl acetate hydrolase
MTEDMRSRMATMHQRDPSGELSATAFELPPDPEVHMGGHGLYATVPDYLRFIRMWLNDGAGEHGQVLRPETVEMAVQKHSGDNKVVMLPGVIPSLSNDAEFFPGMPKSWSLPFMLNDEPAPTGRPANELAWAGLANLYYWIDRSTGIGGYWATQILPFADLPSVGGYLQLETAVYDAMAASPA